MTYNVFGGTLNPAQSKPKFVNKLFDFAKQIGLVTPQNDQYVISRNLSKSQTVQNWRSMTVVLSRIDAVRPRGWAQQLLRKVIFNDLHRESREISKLKIS